MRKDKTTPITKPVTAPVLTSPTMAELGGKARAKKLTPKARSEIARKAAATRWAGEGRSPVVAYGAPERPLRIGGIEIPCYVLADGRRVLAQRGLHSGIGLSTGGGRGGERKLVSLLGQIETKGIEIRDLVLRVNSPIRFVHPSNSVLADGYEATILPDLCAVLINASRQGKLHKQLAHVAERAGILQHGFATVGIVALVDEATGYQDVRARDALAKILERFVAKELRPWVKTFPSTFYQEIFRLHGWAYSEDCGRPGVIGNYTTNIVYKRLAPGVLEELKRQTPKDERGRPKAKLFQSLTDDHGHPRLREHITGVTMLMKYSPDWVTFQQRLDREYPQWGATMALPFPDNYAGPEPQA